MTGVAGAVGGYVVEPAVADGLDLVAGASARDLDPVRGSGADHVVERGSETAARARELIP
ncbi:hypothetical protein OHB56_14680 [Streptomyces sp. NBC_01635]|uniref:hypothetical protein n=1 Tax=Streptomyces sp. NBC_01635 TaxID=2975904 RepID=UPI00386A4B35|nr:hypothetical protein OHB56_14680 [Streptomyces sp. NBC_01635]